LDIILADELSEAETDNMQQNIIETGSFGNSITILKTKSSAAVIDGLIRDQNGNPLAGAQVFLPSSKTGGITNAQGEVTFGDIQSGFHDLHVSMIGYQNQNFDDLHISKGDIANLDLILEVSSIEGDAIETTHSVKAKRSLVDKIKDLMGGTRSSGKSSDKESHIPDAIPDHEKNWFEEQTGISFWTGEYAGSYQLQHIDENSNEYRFRNESAGSDKTIIMELLSASEDKYEALPDAVSIKIFSHIKNTLGISFQGSDEIIYIDPEQLEINVMNSKFIYITFSHVHVYRINANVLLPQAILIK